MVTTGSWARIRSRVSAVHPASSAFADLTLALIEIALRYAQQADAVADLEAGAVGHVRSDNARDGGT